MPITESARLMSVHSSHLLFSAHGPLFICTLLTRHLGSDMMSSPTCAQPAYPLPCSWCWLYFFSPGIFLLLSITHRISLRGVPEQNATDGGLKRYHLLFSSGGWGSKVKAWTGWSVLRPLSLAHRRLTSLAFSLCVQMAFPLCVSASLFVGLDIFFL